jgi:hypothetical protein
MGNLSHSTGEKTAGIVMGRPPGIQEGISHGQYPQKRLGAILAVTVVVLSDLVPEGSSTIRRIHGTGCTSREAVPRFARTILPDSNHRRAAPMRFSTPLRSVGLGIAMFTRFWDVRMRRQRGQRGPEEQDEV